MKIVTYNVNGLRPRIQQFGSLLKLLSSLDADIICFQVPPYLNYIYVCIYIIRWPSPFFNLDNLIKLSRVKNIHLSRFNCITAFSVTIGLYIIIVIDLFSWIRVKKLNLFFLHWLKKVFLLSGMYAGDKTSKTWLESRYGVGRWIWIFLFLHQSSYWIFRWLTCFLCFTRILEMN